MRQNFKTNAILFSAFGANMTMVSSQIIANECLAVLRTPLLAEFLFLIRHKDDAWAHALVARLQQIAGDQTPAFWSFGLDGTDTPGLLDASARFEVPVRIGDLSRDSRLRSEGLACLALLAVRGPESIELPGDDFVLEPGDRVPFAGREGARDDQLLLLRDANVAAYVLAGRSHAGGWIWRGFRRT